MAMLLFLLSIATGAVGVLLFALAATKGSSVLEIEALIAFAMTAVLFSGALVVNGLHRVRLVLEQIAERLGKAPPGP